MFVQAIKRGHEYGCVSSLNKSPAHLLVCVCVGVCNGSAPGSAIKEAPRDVCLYTRKIKGRHGCVYVCVYHNHYMYANTAEQLRLHKAEFYC